MTGNTDQIVRALFGTSRLEDVAVEQLKDLVNEYPSFHIGHYLLSKKLQVVSYDEFLRETPKTALHFNNPFWLDWLLLHENAAEEKVSTLTANPSWSFQEHSAVTAPIEHKEPEPQHIPVPEALLPAESGGESQALFSHSPGQNEPAESVNEQPEQKQMNYSPEPESSSDVVSEHTEHAEFESLQSSETPVHDEAPMINQEQLAWNETTFAKPAEPAEHPDPTTAEFSPISPWEPVFNTGPDLPQEIAVDAGDPARPAGVPEIPALHPDEDGNKNEPEIPVHHPAESDPEKPSEIPDPPEKAVPPKPAPDQPDIENPDAKPEISAPEKNPEVPETPNVPDPGPDTEIPTLQGSSYSEEPLYPTEIYQQATELPADPIPEAPALIQTTQEPPSVAAELPKPTAPVEKLAFDPYHTIDYFASLGIKFVQEENPNDKFGKHLKSFTDWLKVMKKLPQKSRVLASDETMEAEITTIAAHSNEEKDVITETMADVLARQGKADKAIAIYLKLSFLNPGKTAYFAAKIQELKRIDL